MSQLNYLSRMNDDIRKLHWELQDFEGLFWRTVDIEPETVWIYVDSVGAYHGYNFYLKVSIKGANWWSEEWHNKFCEDFGVRLDRIIKNSVKTADNYGDGFEEEWTYVYKPKEWRDYSSLSYDDLKVVKFNRINLCEGDKCGDC